MSRLVRVVALVFALTGNTAVAAPAPRRTNILLIVLDTVRYDAVSPGNTPFLDSLGRRGVVFSNAYSTHDFTPTSHFSMMTGLYDGLGTDDDRVENGVAWQLEHSGYSTFAVIANNLLGKSQMPVLRGFSDFKETGDVPSNNAGGIIDMLKIDTRLALFHVRSTPHNRARLYYSAERILPMVLDELRQAKGPYFGFVNLVDAHEPYVPHARDYQLEASLPEGFEGDVMTRRLGPELAHPEAIADPVRRAFVLAKIAEVGYARLLSLDLSTEDLAVYKRRYLATVRELDGVLQQFFESADREHLLDNTLVIITSDHGEEFGEAGHITHMLHDHGDLEATRHVPMIVLLPSSMPRTAAMIDRRVSLASLAPTLYDVAGVDFSAFAKSYNSYPRSLAPLITTLTPAVAHAAPPTHATTDHSLEEEERQKEMLSLGYLQH
jgi:arylsulfatase A-like enzyme